MCLIHETHRLTEQYKAESNRLLGSWHMAELPEQVLKDLEEQRLALARYASYFECTYDRIKQIQQFYASLVIH